MRPLQRMLRYSTFCHQKREVYALTLFYTGSMTDSGKQSALRVLQTIPGVGKAVSEDLLNLGYQSVEDLKNEDHRKCVIDCAYCKVRRSIGACCIRFAAPCILHPPRIQIRRNCSGGNGKTEEPKHAEDAKSPMSPRIENFSLVSSVSLASLASFLVSQ